MRRPVNAPYTITTEHGVPNSYAKFGYHSGVDYAVPLNRPIYAPVSGQLTNVVSPTGGNMVVIFDGRFYHRLMHNNLFSRSNGYVSEGTEVAKAGTTGLSTGVHCHWDINTEGVNVTSFSRFVSPVDFLAGKYVVTTPQGGDMVTDKAQLDRLYQAVLRRNRGAGEGEDVYLGKDSGFVFDDLFKSRERVSRLANDASIAKQAATIPSLQSTIASRDAQIADLKSKLAAAQAQPPTTGGTFTEADRTALKETNSVVKAIQALLSKIFK